MRKIRGRASTAMYMHNITQLSISRCCGKGE